MSCDIDMSNPAKRCLKYDEPDLERDHLDNEKLCFAVEECSVALGSLVTSANTFIVTTMVMYASLMFVSVLRLIAIANPGYLCSLQGSPDERPIP